MTSTENVKRQHSAIESGYEPIKGYVLEKRIGRGGYGEVWRAEAPGGLKKAVKFVFGQHDEHRASQELKSLERIKRVQHPFILTLERFELINNQLVIVTELADGSLEDIFKEHCDRGSCGIPRESLLGYMKDAADALDYLHELYKLQHLDIKPANLLMVGGRVKVADFGLLKDLGEVDCSVVGGLTPIYAPPELFDGRPSINSDQYSLAVMYQELLTGTRPFSGRTIAQLATQHVHNAPNLESLPACDRPSVARALEKSPERRFDSCTQFVEKLLHPHGRFQASAQTAPPESSQVEKHDVEALPQLDLTDDSHSETSQIQALVVALGGTGADFLHQLRSRVLALGDDSPMTLHSVLIDTDLVTTQSAAMNHDGNHVTPCRTVCARLRSPKQYREGGTDRFRSLSRRWIYNVPRNAATEGMRPLGRLALVDHGTQVKETLQTAIEELKGYLTANSSAKVYVVGSLSGGSGSGMYIDVVHLLRHLMDAAAMANDPIISLLTTCRFQGDPARPLALHTTKSAIEELGHFLNPEHGYPGDEGAHWPSLPAARTPLHDAYVIPQSSDIGAPNALEAAVNYLWCDATVCGDWFAQGRREEGKQATSVTALRTVSAVAIGGGIEGKANVLAPFAAKTLLLKWLGNPNDASETASDFARRIVRRCHLTPEALVGKAVHWYGPTARDRESRISDYLHTLAPHVVRKRDSLRSHLIQWLSSGVDLEQSEIVVNQISDQVRHELNLQLQDGRLNLSSAILGIERLRENVRQLNEQLMTQSESEFQLLTLKTAGSSSSANLRDLHPEQTDLRDACRTGEELIQIFGSRVAAAITSSLELQFEELVETYSSASVAIAHCIQGLSDELGSDADPWQEMPDTVKEQLPSVLKTLNQEFASLHLANVIKAPSGANTATMAGDISTAASKIIRESIEKSVASLSQSTAQGDGSDVGCDDDSDTIHSDGSDATLSTMNQAEKPETEVFDDLGTMALGNVSNSSAMTQTCSWSNDSNNQEPPVLAVEAAVNAVKPTLLECGGKQRLYLICNNNLEAKEFLTRFPEELTASVTTILAPTSQPMLIQEGQQITVKNVIAWLNSLTGDNRKISNRLSTRSDVNWDSF